MNKQRFGLLPLALLLGACVTTAPQAPKHTVPFPKKIALLPFSNLSLDVQAPELFRDLIDNDLASGSIELISERNVTDQLRQMGISEGGQLHAVQPQKLAAALQVDGLLYGEIEEFKSVNVGIYQRRQVDVRMWLVDGATGEKLWESERKKAKSEINPKAGAESLAGAVGEKMGGIKNSPFWELAEDVALLLCKDLGKAKKAW